MQKKWFISIFLLALAFSPVYAQWQQVANGLIGSYDVVYGGALSSKDGVIWVGIHDLWKSVDSGKTWSKTNFSSGSFICQISFFDQNNGIVATYDLGIFLTRDGGNSWQNILSISECLGATFNSTKNEILAIDRNNFVGTAHYTSDGGATWLTQQVESTAGTYHILSRGNNQAYILSRSLSPSKESHILESTDFGVSWQKHLGGVDYDSYSFALDSCNKKQIYIGNEEFNQIDNGFSEIYSSTDDGDSWAVVNRQVSSFFSSACETSADAVFVVSSLGNGIFRSTDAGKNWKSIGGPTSHQDSRMITVLNDNIIFAADNNGNIWRTTNSGGDSLAAPSKGGNVTFSISSKRIINDSLNVTIALPIYLNCKTTMPSFDMVVHYPTIPLTYLHSVLPNGKIVDVSGGQWSGRSKIHFDAADLAGRKDSLIGYCVFKWLPYEFDCAHITFDSIQANVLDNPCSGTPSTIASATGGFIGSYPSCGQTVETDVDPPQFVILSAKDSFSDTLEVNDGRSTDEGLRSIKWVAESGTDTSKIIVLPVIPGIAPCFNDKINHTIRVVQRDSTASGCYDFTFTDCLGHQSFTKICMTAHVKSGVDNGQSFVLSLEANHPNPFSHLTTLAYSTSEYGIVTLSLYDDLGREQARIIDRMQQPGRYSIDFDGSKLPSGNYILRLQSGGKVISRHVVIER